MFFMYNSAKRRNNMESEHQTFTTNSSTLASVVTHPLEATLESTQPEIRNGFLTSEFLQSVLAILIPNIVTVLVIFNVVQYNVASILATALIAISGGVISILSALGYIKSRTALKKSLMDGKNSIQHRQYELEKQFHQQSIENRQTQELERKRFLITLFEKGLLEKEAVKKEFGI